VAPVSRARAPEAGRRAAWAGAARPASIFKAKMAALPARSAPEATLFIAFRRLAGGLALAALGGCASWQDAPRLLAALNGAHLGAWYWDIDSGRVSWSRGAQALFGLDPKQPLQRQIGQTFPLAEARRAHETLESRATVGASLLIP